jgi:hypothetical protein
MGFLSGLWFLICVLVYVAVMPILLLVSLLGILLWILLIPCKFSVRGIQSMAIDAIIIYREHIIFPSNRLQLRYSAAHAVAWCKL